MSASLESRDNHSNLPFAEANGRSLMRDNFQGRQSDQSCTVATTSPLSTQVSVSLPFLAGLLLKLHRGETWTNDEVGLLESTAASAAPAPIPASASAPDLLLSDTPVKKTKPRFVSVIPPSVEVSVKHCLARMVQKSAPIEGTEDNKVYTTKQCSRLRLKGRLLCAKCEEYYTAFKEKAKGKRNWEGFINEKPLDDLHVVGSKWFHEHYPTGLPNMSSEPAAPTPVPSDPALETLLAENAPILEIKWATVRIAGVDYIYNIKDRRIYRADLEKEGEDQILWDTFCGKYIGGAIDNYALENEDEEEE